MSEIVYKNNRLYNQTTQSYLKFVATHRKAVMFESVYITTHVYTDEITNEKFVFTQKDLDVMRNIGNSDLRVF